MIRLLTDALTKDLRKQMNDSLESAQRENEDLKERIRLLEGAILDHAKAISVLASIQSNTLRELRVLVSEGSKTKKVTRKPEDDIIN